MQTAQSQKFLKIGEAASKLGLSSETLRRWEKAGKISFSRTPGGKRLFSEADLEAIGHLLEPKYQPTQTSTSASKSDQSTQDRIVLSFPRPRFPTVANSSKFLIAAVILILVSGNVFLFSKTPYSHQAVLGVETFVAPAVEEVTPILSPVMRFLSGIGTFFEQRIGLFLLAFIQSTGVTTTNTTSLSLPSGIKIEGNNIFLGVSNEGTTRVNNNFEVIGSSAVQSLQIQGSLDVQGPTNVKQLTAGNLGLTNNLSLSSTSPTISIGNTGVLKITDGTNTLLSLTDNGTTGNLETTGDLKVDKNITLSGVINSNTFTSTSLVFAGNSPAIYAGTSATSIALDAGTTGAVNIGSSSTGDINLGGGSSSTGCTVTNSNGNFTCSGTGSFSNLSSSSTTSINSTATSGDIFSVTDTVLSGSGSNLSNFTFKNNNSAGSSTINGITVTEQAANSSGTNTSNLLNLTAASGGTVNGINISSATGFTNFFKTPTFLLDSSGNVSGVGTFSAGAGTLTSVTATGNVNSSSGSLQTNGVTRLDNSGNLTAGTGSFGGAVNPSLDATYDFGTATLRWNNAYFAGDVTAGDVVFKNKFRLTENGDKGIDLLNPKGEKVASFDNEGNFWVKGEIRHKDAFGSR